MDRTRNSVSESTVYPPPETNLFQQKLPVDTNCRLPVFPTVLSQSTRHFAHTFKAIPAVQEVFDVLGHDLRHIPELVIEFIEVLGCSTVLVGLLCPLNECIELNKGIWP